ncbi:MAG: hypothetical protein RMK99_12460 [Anaerolineales bacterium]|nr:hypothetical protein [Anaerolineales bacterium]
MKRDWRTQAMVVGAVAGALLGLLAARLYITSVEEEAAQKGETPRFSLSQAVSIGLAVLGVLRQIAAPPAKHSARKKR